MTPTPPPADTGGAPRVAVRRTSALFNRCNLSPWLIAAQEFQKNPQPLEIDGVRRADRRLFDQLANCPDAEQRGQIFHDYLSVKFRLHEWAEHQGCARSSLRSSYILYLRNWGVDSNGHAGAVLKSWAESRFGLPTRYHRAQLSAPEARENYERDHMLGAARTVGAYMQLDLLYTFCQEELQRRFPGELWRILYRGTHDPEEYAVNDRPCETPGTKLVELNNLNSFASDPEVAWEFGSAVWEVKVPLQKIVFFSGLLPRSLLSGESEHLVLGGEYEVKTLLG